MMSAASQAMSTNMILPESAHMMMGNPRRTRCVVSFVTEKGTPCLECQDSHGTAWGIGGYLTVEIRSLKELYSVRVT